ncbi:hypothetical protein [Nocardia carnea]|uniref:hypothetical protein n=1 Tax=Nocardia carnea TaxID=37328 RepID=UPI002455D322|nr:hypothetical protein [Nocardia carnea]
MTRSTTTITINGNPVQISDEQIFLATRDQTPGTPQIYAAFVNNALWPPTQLIGLATGVPGKSGETYNYNSHAALRALNELGFATFERVEYDTLGTVVVRESRKRT